MPKLLLAFLSISFFGVLTGCSNEARSPNVALEAPTGNLGHDRLMELDTPKRATILGQIAGNGCTGIDTFFMGMYPKDNSAFWSVRCADQRAYQISIEANSTGSTSVMDCRLLKAVADVDCFAKLNSDDRRPPRTKKQIQADLNRLPPVQPIFPLSSP